MAGKPFALTIDYQRQTDALSISSLPVQAASTPGPDTPGHVSMTGILPWVLAGIGLLLIVAGIFGFVTWQRGSQVSTVSQTKIHLQLKESEEDIHLLSPMRETCPARRCILPYLRHAFEKRFDGLIQFSAKINLYM